MRIVAGIAVVLALAGCSGVSTMNVAEMTVAEPLHGPFPVGRWLCIDDLDFERYRRSNTGWATLRPTRIICNLFGGGLGKGLEVLPDGVGWVLRVYGHDTTPPPATVFRIQGSDLYYDRWQEFRWWYEAGELLIQTSINNHLTVDTVSADVARITNRFNHRLLLFRIGSAVFVRLDEFLECVENNYDRPLFEVVDCGEPPDTGRN